MPLSHAAHLYLALDLLLPPARHDLGTVTVPRNGTRVAATEAAPLLVAAALWGLRESGAVELRHEPRRLLSLRHVTVHPGPGGEPVGAMEAAFLRCLDERKPRAADVVGRWFGHVRHDPWGEAVAGFQQELVTARVLRLVAVEPPPAGVTRVAPYELPVAPVPEAVAAAQAAADDVAARWLAFAERERDLARTLVKECARGLEEMDRVD